MCELSTTNKYLSKMICTHRKRVGRSISVKPKREINLDLPHASHHIDFENAKLQKKFL